MKAAVLHRFGRVPRYEAYLDPRLEPGEIAIRVRAVALENVDKAMARGSSSCPNSGSGDTASYPDHDIGNGASYLPIAASGTSLARNYRTVAATLRGTGIGSPSSRAVAIHNRIASWALASASS